MQVTADSFSFLAELSDEQISRQIGYCLSRGWAVAIEYSDDPHPRNSYWETFGAPLLECRDAAGVMAELHACRRSFPRHYIKVNAFDSARGREALRLAFIAGRPGWEPLFAGPSPQTSQGAAWPAQRNLRRGH